MFFKSMRPIREYLDKEIDVRGPADQDRNHAARLLLWYNDLHVNKGQDVPAERKANGQGGDHSAGEPDGSRAAAEGEAIS